jgi:hypothetical protein
MLSSCLLLVVHDVLVLIVLFVFHVKFLLLFGLLTFGFLEKSCGVLETYGKS